MRKIVSVINESNSSWNRFMSVNTGELTKALQKSLGKDYFVEHNLDNRGDYEDLVSVTGFEGEYFKNYSCICVGRNIKTNTMDGFCIVPSKIINVERDLSFEDFVKYVKKWKDEFLNK